jgi:hypothetical protein
MRHWILKAISYLVIFFFVWTSGGLFNVAYAANNETQKPTVNQKQEKRPEEKFQKAIEDIRSIILDSKTTTFENRKSKLKTKRDEIDLSDNEIKSQFAATEKKLKDAGLPQEILQRHYNFVKHYEDNLKELRTNLDAADKTKTKAEFDTQIQKVQKHLEKVAPPRKHKALDPNKLPHRISDIKRKEPRTKPEEFQRDLKHRANAVIPVQTGIQENLNNFVIPAKAGIQDTINNNKPLLFAANGSLTGLVESLPKYEEQQNLPHPLFKKEGSNAFNSPPFLKGDKGGFSNNINEPIVLALAHDAPTSADLAETIDVQLTSAIKAKAAELNYSPVKIYNWVRNNVEYVPTYGSIQGADMCLQTLQGNDFDIASLLIALLRASGIHARYVYGTIELPIERVMNWVGGFTDSNAAVNFIASGGTPVAGIISGGKISSVRMEHVWVEAYVKYYPLRGAKHITGQGDSWIPLDASYKQYNYTQGIDIKSAVPFDAQGFVNQVQSTATIDTANSSVTNVNSTYIQQQMQNYQAQVKNYIEQNYPNATVGDVLGKQEIIKQSFSILAGTLPYQKSIIGIRYSEIPDSLRHKITFKVTKDIYDAEMGTPIIITKRLPEIAGKKITLSYSPATADDEATINSYLPKPHADGTPIQPSELPTSLPAYLINLKPELRIDGVVIATGTAIGMGYQDTFDMVFSEPGPGGGTDIVSNQITAGSYNAIGFNLGRISQDQLKNMKEKIEATKNQLQDGTDSELTREDYVGDLLYATAIIYLSMVTVSNFINAKSLGVNFITLTSETIFSCPLEVTYSWGIPVSASNSSISMDADRLLYVVKAVDGDPEKAKRLMLTSSQQSSVLENAVPEMVLSKDTNTVSGVSAVKALKIANDQGIPIYTINQSNINTVLPQLQVDDNVKTDIQNAVNTGKEVTVSKTNIIFNGWTGCGYIIINPTTGAGAYMISGGLSGAWALFGAFCKSIATVISNIPKYAKLEWVSWCKDQAEFLAIVGFLLKVVDIVSNPKLNEIQKIGEICTWLLSVILLSEYIIPAIAIGAGLMEFLILSVMMYFLVTLVCMLIIGLIEPAMVEYKHYLAFRSNLRTTKA